MNYLQVADGQQIGRIIHTTCRILVVKSNTPNTHIYRSTFLDLFHFIIFMHALQYSWSS